jgi:hypothetical protein
LSGDQRTNVKSFLGKRYYTWFDHKGSYGKGSNTWWTPFSFLQSIKKFVTLIPSCCTVSKSITRGNYDVAVIVITL